MCMQGLVVDVEAFGEHVRGTPGLLERLQRVCSPKGQQQLLEIASEVRLCFFRLFCSCCTISDCFVICGIVAT